MLVNGEWKEKWNPLQAKDQQGRFIRQTSYFRNTPVEWETPYHLYVALICPWAHRTLITRKLKGLEKVISVSIVEPFLTDEGWKFGKYPDASEDSLNGFTQIHQLYTLADSLYTGRATVPLLWDKQAKTIVNNESPDIIRLLNTCFENLRDTSRDTDINLYPQNLQGEIDKLNTWMYDTLNNGVYKVRFATTQIADEEAVIPVFNTLDELENRLSDNRIYLFRDCLTENDIRLYITLVHFDAAYHGIFKCNIRKLADYSFLQNYLERLSQIPALKKTTNITHIKQGYYSIKALNPSKIVPTGPTLPWYQGK